MKTHLDLGSTFWGKYGRAAWYLIENFSWTLLVHSDIRIRGDSANGKLRVLTMAYCGNLQMGIFCLVPDADSARQLEWLSLGPLTLWDDLCVRAKGRATKTSKSTNLPVMMIPPQIPTNNGFNHGFLGGAKWILPIHSIAGAMGTQADEIEFWLDAAGHAPVGPEAVRACAVGRGRGGRG